MLSLPSKSLPRIFNLVDSEFLRPMDEFIVLKRRNMYIAATCLAPDRVLIIFISRRCRPDRTMRDIISALVRLKNQHGVENDRDH